jgi:hypothetical protein
MPEFLVLPHPTSKISLLTASQLRGRSRGEYFSLVAIVQYQIKFTPPYNLQLEGWPHQPRPFTG